jgi:hypothetical protein
MKWTRSIARYDTIQIASNEHETRYNTPISDW